jgi:hypothetical protein
VFLFRRAEGGAADLFLSLDPATAHLLRGGEVLGSIHPCPELSTLAPRRSCSAWPSPYEAARHVCSAMPR